MPLDRSRWRRPRFRNEPDGRARQTSVHRDCSGGGLRSSPGGGKSSIGRAGSTKAVVSSPPSDSTETRSPLVNGSQMRISPARGRSGVRRNGQWRRNRHAGRRPPGREPARARAGNPAPPERHGWGQTTRYAGPESSSTDPQAVLRKPIEKHRQKRRKTGHCRSAGRHENRPTSRASGSDRQAVREARHQPPGGHPRNTHRSSALGPPRGHPAAGNAGRQPSLRVGHPAGEPHKRPTTAAAGPSLGASSPSTGRRYWLGRWRVSSFNSPRAAGPEPRNQRERSRKHASRRQ